MIELELKSAVHDLDAVLETLERSGARLGFRGRLIDRRYDRPERSLRRNDHLLRVRTYHDADGVRSYLDWKGPTSVERGYKRRDELSTQVADGALLASMLGNLGYVVTMVIDRQIWQYELADAMVRLERYPRMDDLVEVEGSPEAIERAIAMTGLPRDGFTAERLAEFVRRFEARTGERAALSDADLSMPTG